MKKTLITSMCLALALSSTACGGSQKKAAAQAVTEATPVPTTAVETTTIAATTASEPSTDKTLSSQRDEIPITSVLDTSAEFAQPEKNETLPQNTASFFALDADDFIEAFRIQTTNYDMCKWSEKKIFESNGKQFESYTLENILGNAYIAISRQDDNSLTDIYLTCNRGTVVYFYTVSILVSINENIDYENIINSLGITETDEEEPGIHVSQTDGKIGREKR